MTLECPATDTSPTATGTATATDLCDSAPAVTYSDVSTVGSVCGGTGVITRTWTATDCNDNTATAIQESMDAAKAVEQFVLEQVGSADYVSLKPLGDVLRALQHAIAPYGAAAEAAQPSEPEPLW